MSTVTDPRSALPAEAAMLLEAIDDMTDGLILLDPEDRFILCNSRYSELYPEVADILVAGTPLDEIITTYSHRLHRVTPIDAQDHARRRNDAWREGETAEELTPSGRWIEMRDYRTAGGYWVGVRIDITERREAEQRLRELNETLEQRVEERSRALADAHEALVRKERLTVLGQITGSVAHELRNPLGTIAATIELISKKADQTPDLERAVERASRSMFRCNAIIDELLSYARTSSAEPVPTPFDQWLSGTLGTMPVPGTIALKQSLGAEGATVALDRERFRRVLLNLIDNAVDALGRDDGGDAGEIHVSSEIASGTVRLTISDTGPGVSDDVLEKIFEPLFSTKSFGVGLGLPIVVQTVEEHGGSLQLRNRTQGGVVVEISLPIAAP